MAAAAFPTRENLQSNNLETCHCGRDASLGGLKAPLCETHRGNHLPGDYELAGSRAALGGSVCGGGLTYKRFLVDSHCVPLRIFLLLQYGQTKTSHLKPPSPCAGLIIDEACGLGGGDARLGNLQAAGLAKTHRGNHLPRRNGFAGGCAALGVRGGGLAYERFLIDCHCDLLGFLIF